MISNVRALAGASFRETQQEQIAARGALRVRLDFEARADGRADEATSTQGPVKRSGTRAVRATPAASKANFGGMASSGKGAGGAVSVSASHADRRSNRRDPSRAIPDPCPADISRRKTPESTPEHLSSSHFSR